VSHPCTDHLASCDHCYLCETVGICCASVSSAVRAQLEASHRHPYAGLTAAILTEAQARTSLADRLRADAQRSQVSRALPAAPAPGPLPPPRHRKEPIHVTAARTPR
jgi:hypothetical protein